MAEVRIRAVDDATGCGHAEDLQRAAWGMADVEVVPRGQLITAAGFGGMVLVAYDGDQPVGFVYGFPGLDGDETVLCSHMLGVVPEYRSRDLGRRLKLAQRDAARERGMRRVVWTFDPLESRNAYLNLHKLGAVAHRYYVDRYGEMRDELNRGLPTDRLLADWRLDEPHGRHHVADSATAPALGDARVDGGLPRPDGLDRGALGAPTARVAVPADVGGVKRADADLALAWRLHVREALRAAFDAGLRAVDFHPPSTGSGRPGSRPVRAALSWYVLSRVAPS